jgi:esterase/lipase
MTQSQFMPSKHIVFIHGLFVNQKSWHAWVAYFSALGYTCHTPVYPYHDGEPEQLRTQVHPNLGKINFDDVMQMLIQFIQRLPEKPIVIGHSMGGLAVQKLINMDLACMGIAIDPAPPQGIFTTTWSFIKGNLPVINPLKGNSVFMPTVEWFQYSFCNHLSLEATQKEFDAYVVPESRNIPRSSTGGAGKINFKKAHEPLLIISGGNDNIVPPDLNLKNFKAYRASQGITAFKQFEGRTHYICGQENWEEVAEYISTWIKNPK